MRSAHPLRRAFITGLLVLVPAWGTFLILRALVRAVDRWIHDLFGPAVAPDIPALSLIFLLGLILLAGVIGTQFLGQWALQRAEEAVKRVPLVRSIYVTLQGMTDVFKFRERFGRSTVVAFPFPREGLWALGFVMGTAPTLVQAAIGQPVAMLFVPTAIHPFTGYLAFIPTQQVQPLNLPVEDAMKMEFSAGLYRPAKGWLKRVEPPPTWSC